MIFISGKVLLRLFTDTCMTVILICQMAYELIGQTAHEWLGTLMFALFIVHHILNRRWTANLLKGKYSPFRIVQTVLGLLILFCMLGSMISGIVLSRHVFAFLPVHSGMSRARNLHMLCGYWNLTLMSLHLGLHWNMMIAMVKRTEGKESAAVRLILRIAAAGIACYGLYAFYKRQIGAYLTGKVMFAFFDYSEPVVFFMIDYTAVMGLFVFIGHYAAVILKSLNKRRKTK